jgi:hypothetical protein
MVDTKEYRVTVFRGNNAKAITAFSITNPVSATGTVDEGTKTVTVTVPYGTARTGMDISIAHTGASVTFLLDNTSRNGSPAVFTGQNLTASRIYRVTAADGSTQDYEVTVNVAPSTNANLSDLTVNTGTLSPAFAAGTVAYTINVPSGTSAITITGTKADSTATLEYQKGADPPQATGAFTGLVPGNNTLKVIVTAQDGVTTKTYTVTVSVAAASTNADLSNLTVSPGTLGSAFAAGTFAYAVSLPYGSTSITLMGTKADSTATLEYQKNAGALQSTGNFTGLVSGDVLKAVVTAQDGVTTRTYEVTVFELNTVTAIAGYLAIASEPVSLTVAIDLGGAPPDNWEYLVYAIGYADKNVELDLSACTMSGTVFDPDYSFAPFPLGKDKIVSLVLPDTAESIQGSSLSPQSAFKYFTNLEEVSGGNVETVGEYAFYDCEALTTVNFPAATVIGVRAFTNCEALTTVDLPAATDIGDRAFSGCRALTSLTFGNTVPTLSEIFYLTNSGPLLTIHVPPGKVDAYTAAWGVSAFTDAADVAPAVVAVYGSSRKDITITDTP